MRARHVIFDPRYIIQIHIPLLSIRCFDEMDRDTTSKSDDLNNAIGKFYWVKPRPQHHNILTWINLNPAGISNHTPSKLWDEIIYPLPNFNGCTVEVWKWISNFISHFIIDVITYPCWDWSECVLVKWVMDLTKSQKLIQLSKLLMLYLNWTQTFSSLI